MGTPCLLQAMMKDGVLPLEPDEDINSDEREEMRRQLQARKSPPRPPAAAARV